MELGFNPYLAFGWCLLAGFIMSMGAGGGGILAGIGHISLLGIADPNMIKVINQILEVAGRIFSVPLYYRQKRLLWPLAFTFGIGAPIGAIIGSWFSAHFLSDMGVYKPVFGILVAIVAARMLYEGWAGKAVRSERLRRVNQASDRIRKAYNERRRSAGTSDMSGLAPRSTELSWCRITIDCGGELFSFNPVAAAGGGFVISFVGAAMGVGGGFLVAPFMASILLFPMFLVAGTALVALMLPLIVSIVTYTLLQVHVDWWLVGIEVPAIILGSFLGPMLNRHMNEKAMKTFVAILLLGIGIYYML